MQKVADKTQFSLTYKGICDVLRSLNEKRTGKRTVGTDAQRKTIRELETFGIARYGFDAMRAACAGVHSKDFLTGARDGEGAAHTNGSAQTGGEASVEQALLTRKHRGQADSHQHV